jgi:hypothetical protein
MKTTVDLADDLLRAAKRTAANRGTTLRDLIERGLRHEIAEQPDAAYTLVDASFTGSGTQPGIDEGDWRTLRDLIYEGRGG